MKHVSGSGIQIIVPKPKIVFKAYATALPAIEADGADIFVDPLDSAASVAKYRLAVICSTCTKWRDGVAMGLETDGEPRCIANEPCGGLAVRRGYPQYSGSFDVRYLIENCVVCGVESTKRVTTPDGKQRGYCDHHYEVAVKILEGK